MTEQRKAVKVSVVPARQPLHQVVVRPQHHHQTPQIIIRQAAPQSVLVRQPTPVNQQLVLRNPSQQSLVVRPQSAGQIGHIRITPQQLASLTGNGQQQIVVRSQQLKSPVRPQQFIIKTSPTVSQPVMLSTASPVNNLTHKHPIMIQKKPGGSPVKSYVVGGLANTKLASPVQPPGQSVVTYIKQNNTNNAKSLPVNTQGSAVRVAAPTNTNLDSILTSNLIKLGGTKQVSTVRLPAGSNLSSSVRISGSSSVTLPTVPISSAILQLQASKPAVSLINMANSTSPKRSHVLVNTIHNTKSATRTSPGQISLLSPSRSVTPKPLTSSSPKLEGLQLVTADGKFINAQGLHLLSPNGTVVKAENVLQNISLSPEKSGAAVTETAQQLISNIQQPLPLTPGDSLSLSPAKPPLGILSTGSPPPLPIIPNIRLPTSPVKDAKDLLLTKAVSPSKILPPPPSLLLAGKGKNIEGLLPTQPLLPSQLKNLTPVSRSLNLPPNKKPAKPRAKSKKEQQKAKMQKLESNLNVQQILSVIDKKFTNNNKLICNDSEVERDYLNSLEAEARGSVLTAEMVSTEEKYYRLHKVCRYIDLNNTTEDDEDQSLVGHINDSYLHNMMKKHQRRKRRKQTLLNVPEHELERGPGMDQRMLKGSKGRGRPNRYDKTESGSDQASVRRHKLWLSIMKKEVAKAGKARNYNSKEKMANAKRLATACMRVQRLRAMESQRAMKEAFWRAKRLTREMQAHWKKYEREEKQQKKAKEKAAQEQRKHDIELLEAKRQQRKLNFLITQTELYAHFMAGKLGHQSEDTEKTILSRLESDVTEARLQQLDDYDEVEAKAQARQTASMAAEKQENMKRNFDQKCGNLNMSEAAEHAGDRPQPTIFQGTLKTYQLKGMNWLCSLYDQGINGILADEMGLGKTVQALSFLAYVAETYGVWGPFLVITPASTLHNWQQEIARFVPDFKCIPYWGSPQDRKVLRSCWTQEHLHTKKSSFHIVVTSYQIVITDYKYFTRQTWMYMVLDEAQAIKSASSQRWKMLLDFKCRGRLLLSGTPIQNTMAELWSLLHFVMPALFDSHDEFKEWFSKDIEGHAEGTKGKVDEKQMSRLHLILKPFMLRRIKKDVEHELTEKVEVLVYCPLTIRQKLLYTALKQNLRMEELLAGLGLGSATSAMGVSNLMNLVMQFRKVCNHPELFERREPKSPLVFNIEPQVFARLPFLEKIESFGEQSRFNIFRSDKVNRSLTDTVRKSEKLEVSDSPFSFLRFIQVSPAELERQRKSIYHQYLHAVHLTKQLQLQRYRWSKQEDSFTLRIPAKTSSLPAGLVFTSPSSEFLSHQDARIVTCPETISHRLIRSRHCQHSDGVLNLVPEFVHSARPDEVRRCEARSCPKFLMDLPSSRAAALPSHCLVRSRAVQYQCQDHDRLMVGPRLSARGLLTGGLQATLPALGWSGITIPDRHSLISDGGKLYVLDGLLARLKEGGHRVLIYSQMTRMIDLLEEYMSHRQHSYMRLDGSSKIHERRDMVADFQTRQDIFVFLLSTRAGGLGINLTAADTVIFYDSDWNPTVDQQAMDRAHRLGQTRQVTVYRLICKGTIEERILQRAREKSEIHRMVIQGGSFKGKAGDLKPKEVVSLLLDDDEIENRVKVKIEEEVEKESEKKKETKKVKKRAGGSLNKENGKKAKVEENESGSEEEDKAEDPKPLFDFAGDKMGPKKPKGRGGGKRGRPRGSGKSLARRDQLNHKKSQAKVENFSLESLVNDSGGIFGFYNQM